MCRMHPYNNDNCYINDDDRFDNYAGDGKQSESSTNNDND